MSMRLGKLNKIEAQGRSFLSGDYLIIIVRII